MPKSSPLWAITSYFNPCGYKRRLKNYRIFRGRLTVPLVTVELAYGGEFELDRGDAELLIQLRGGDVMWQKERLLNIALDHLPETCEKIAWLDCDVIFERDDWHEEARDLLDRAALVQPYARVYDLPRDMLPESPAAKQLVTFAPSFAAALPCGRSAAELLRPLHGPESRRARPQSGVAWAARREILSQHGFYDVAVVGGGDRAAVAAAFGEFEAGRDNHRMNERQFEYYSSWAKPYYQCVAGRIGYVKGDIYHLWHGETKNRQYGKRWADMQKYHFDPYGDIALSESGCWRWNSHKPELHEHVRGYFRSRNEDC